MVVNVRNASRLVCTNIPTMVNHITITGGIHTTWASPAAVDKSQPPPCHHDDNNNIHRGLQLRTRNIREGMETYKNASKQLVQTKWTDALNFYESFSHMDEVREAHNKVIAIQSRLLEAQQRRSQSMIELTAVRKEQQMIQDELVNCSRSADRYLGLVRLEIDARKAEQAKVLEFQTEDQNERNLFTHMTAAVTASHEKEKIYANTVKYWSILLSILGAAVGVAGTSLSYYYRQNTLKNLADGYENQIAALHDQLEQMQSEFVVLACEIKLARLSMNRVEDRMRTEVTTRHESWKSYLWRNLNALSLYIWPKPPIDRLQKMRNAGGDGSWRS